MKPSVPPANREYLNFLAPYEPAIRKLALAVRELVLEEARGSTELIYDAYNAVATGYSFTGRPSDACLHIAVYARWVNLGFNRGCELEDPQRLLQGTGRWVRHIRVSRLPDLQNPVLRAFVKAAVSRAIRPDGEIGQPGTKSKSVVRAIYAKKRRPGTEK